MLVILAVLAFLSAAFLLFRFSRRHDPELKDQFPVAFEPPLNARALFAPSDSDLKKAEIKREARSIARREYHARVQDRERVDAALAAWHTNRDRKTAADLLAATAEHGLDGDFTRAANEVIKTFRDPGISGLRDNDLAALIDSHIRLLSNSERSSGAIFWLKQEVAKLRPESDV
jgi:hypothetical protein